MVAGVLRVIGNIVTKMTLLMLFDLIGWVQLNPGLHDTGRNWLAAAWIGTVFTAVTMAVLEVLFRRQVRTHGRSLLLLPVAGCVLLLMLLVLAPDSITTPNLFWFAVVGVLLSLSVPIASRRGKQLVAVTGEQPPIE